MLCGRGGATVPTCHPAADPPAQCLVHDLQSLLGLAKAACMGHSLAGHFSSVGSWQRGLGGGYFQALGVLESCLVVTSAGTPGSHRAPAHPRFSSPVSVSALCSG